MNELEESKSECGESNLKGCYSDVGKSSVLHIFQEVGKDRIPRARKEEKQG